MLNVLTKKLMINYMERFFSEICKIGLRMRNIELWTQLRPSDLEQTPVTFPCVSNGNHIEPTEVMKKTHSEAREG